MAAWRNCAGRNGLNTPVFMSPRSCVLELGGWATRLPPMQLLPPGRTIERPETNQAVSDFLTKDLLMAWVCELRRAGIGGKNLPNWETAGAAWCQLVEEIPGWPARGRVVEQCHYHPPCVLGIWLRRLRICTNLDWLWGHFLAAPGKK